MLSTALFAVMISSVPATAQPIASMPLDVGIVSEPCAVLPQMPSVVAEFISQMERTKAEGAPEPVPTAEGLAIYATWQRDLLIADFAGLCRYRAANRQLPPPGDHRVVFFGDSITEAWSRVDPAFFAGDRINRGISGQTTAQMIGRFRADVIELRPAVVHIMAGTNDIAGNTGPTSLEAIEDNIRSMAELARVHGIAVVIGSVLPARRFDWRPQIEPTASIAALNERLRTYAAQQGFGFADYHRPLDDGSGGLAADKAADGVHPTSSGYALMEPIADKAIADVLNTRKP